MASVVLLATAWGPKHGGINAFNTDFASALGRSLGAGQVACVVLEATPQDREEAAKAGVSLLEVGKSKDHDRLEESRAYEILHLLKNRGLALQADTAWVGHDIHTGELALRLAEVAGVGRSVVIQHMSYRDYISYRDGIGAKAQAKHDRQEALFQSADTVFAVGPLLRDRLENIVGKRQKTAHLLIPGLADITPADPPLGVFRAVTMGRLGPADDRIKQGRLAVAAMASACRAVHENRLLPETLRNVEMLLYGIEKPGGDEEAELRRLAQDKADRAINLIPLQFSENRKQVFEALRQSTVALMPSWHEGFGLTGWEAIAAGVPLIASEKSGLYKCLKAELGDAGLALFKPVDIKGWDDQTGDIHFHSDDERSIREALLQLAADPAKAKANALALRKTLLDKGFTWAGTARQFVEILRNCPGITRRAEPPRWQGPPYLGLQTLKYEHAALFFGRDAQIQALADKLRDSRFVAVVGASGAGKSSLVWAGLLPRLESLQPGGVASWVWLRITPSGADGLSPIERLAEEWGECFNPRYSQVKKALLEGGTALDDCLAQTLPDSQAQILLFIDQFEELFTQVESDDRLPFIQALARLIDTQKMRVLVTMRAEFLGRCLDTEAFGETVVQWFNQGPVLLAAPNETALRQMIEEPAKLAGLSFTPGLVDQIVADTGLKPGNLALMAFALARLYEDCGGGDLRQAVYEGFGRIEGAIADKAKQEFEACAGLDEHEAQSLLGQVFAALVDIDEVSQTATRRRAAWEALKPRLDVKADALVRRFIEERLLLTDGGEQRQTLEVAHEALFRHWPLLAEWIDRRKDQFLLRKRLERDTAEWLRRKEVPDFRWPDKLALDAAAMLDALPQRPASADERRFLGPVRREEMLALLREIDTPHETRATIGVRLAILGDGRPGVGVKDGLPDIVWCPVPEGWVELAEGKGRFEVKPCLMAQYPVTQAQYFAFVGAEDGYFNPRWWQDLLNGPPSEAGRKIPTYANHPAVNVAWIEAVAYCRWLSHRLGQDIRLPYEWEWQQAVCGGQAENRYPWGKNWRENHCNTYESGLNQMVAVGLYPFATSEASPQDMAGNVWEWCLNLYDEPREDARHVQGGNQLRVVRGGSFNYSKESVCTSARDWSTSGRYLSTGFRVLVVLNHK